MSWKPLTDSRPYRWPLSGAWSAVDTALLIIDMQQDFLSPGGYFDQMGYPLAHTRAAIGPCVRLLAAVRREQIPVIYTRESHRADLSDLHPTKRARAEAMGAPIGELGPLGRLLVRGEAGSEVIPELTPAPEDVVIDKPGNGAFHATDLDQILRARGIRHLLLTGVTTDVCVHSTLREANDRGYDCLVLEDCCGAGDPELHRAALATMMNEGGIFGAVSSQATLLAAWDTAEPDTEEPEHENSRSLV